MKGKADPDTVVQRVLQFDIILKYFYEEKLIKDSSILRQFLTGEVLNFVLLSFEFICLFFCVTIYRF
jgi:hypothetical protein